MAYAAIISLKQTLQQILLHPRRYSIPCDNKHIESFHEKIQFLQHFLEEYPSHESNENATTTERRIRDAAYDAEDFVDLRLKNLFDSKSLRLIDAFQNDTSLCFKLIAKFDSIIREVIKIKEQIEIKKAGGSFMQEEMNTGEFGKQKDFQPRNAFRKDSSQLVSSDKKNLMVGFDDHFMQIKYQLTGQSSVLEVISIVGMGGIGKTTLATHVYDDPSFVNHFDIRAWVTVSQSYSVRDILLSMLASMNKLPKGDQFEVDVYQNLKDRRYLIIIDDIWDSNAWDCLKMIFPDDENGSRIILTTRIADVAAYVSPSGTIYRINPLSDEQSWMLLCAKAFGDEPCPLNLQEIGNTIARNCRGLPLSIAVIGGLLSKVEKTQGAWQSVADNVTSAVFSSDDRCLHILRLSFNYLPQYLKACFLYMAVFPKGHEIRVSKLTKMWIAEGFLKQGGDQSPEEVAERCVEDLIDRSLILVSKKTYEGKIKVFRIHDLLLDFCIKEAKDEKFFQTTQSPTNLFPSTTASARRISIHGMEEFEHRRSSTSHVRSLVFFKRCSISSHLFVAFKLLRVLDATYVKFLIFPQQVLELLNLRYLALLYYGDIPASITKLWNLQTLIILGNSMDGSKSFLPEEIWMMVHLRHVWFEKVYQRAATFVFCKNHLVLKDLQTLSGLFNLRFSKEILQSIPNIKEIDVSYDDLGLLGKEWSYYQMENLCNLHHLKALKISNLSGSLNLIPPTLQFPPSLKTLTLSGVGIPWNDLSIIGSLPNLEVLKLISHACQGTEWEPNEDEFCKLKVMVLENSELKQWTADSYHFPRLECLIIRWCDSLVEIPSGMGEIPTLAKIGLFECNDSVVASANDILEKQLSYGNDDFQVIEASAKLKKLLRSYRVRLEELVKQIEEFRIKRMNYNRMIQLAGEDELFDQVWNIGHARVGELIMERRLCNGIKQLVGEIEELGMWSMVPDSVEPLVREIGEVGMCCMAPDRVEELIREIEELGMRSMTRCRVEELVRVGIFCNCVKQLVREIEDLETWSMVPDSTEQFIRDFEEPGISDMVRERMIQDRIGEFLGTLIDPEMLSEMTEPFIAMLRGSYEEH